MVSIKHTFPELSSLLGGETLGIEYKRDLDAKNKKSPLASCTLASSLMAIGNAHGGYLLLGVDNKGKVLGIHSERSISGKMLCTQIGREFMVTPPMGSYEYQEAGQSVIAFFVEGANQSPYQLTDGSLKIRKELGNRQGPENLPFALTELPQWQAQRGIHYDYSSALQPDLEWDDHLLYLDLIALERLKRRIEEGKTEPNLRTISALEQRMDALGLVGTINSRRVLTNAALILLGNNETLRRYIPAQAAQFQAFAPDGSLPVNLSTGQPGLDSSNLLYLAERIEELLRGLVPRKELMDGLFRIDLPAYGDDALREAVMNAFIHRDYSITEPVIIQIAHEHFTITSPGGFYRDVSPSNILFHEPCARNQCLAYACVQLGLMEKSGRGVDRIFWDQIRFLRPLPSYAESSVESVRLTLLGGEGAHEAIRWMYENLLEQDLRARVVYGFIINTLLLDGELSRDAIIAALPGLSESFGHRAITELIDAGLLTRVGHGRGQHLVLSAQFQSALGRPEAFVHQTGMHWEHQRQMVLQYVETHGEITRMDAARLLSKKPDNAVYRLLHSLVQDGHLIRQGERRIAKYVHAKG